MAKFLMATDRRSPPLGQELLRSPIGCPFGCPGEKAVTQPVLDLAVPS